MLFQEALLAPEMPAVRCADLRWAALEAPLNIHIAYRYFIKSVYVIYVYIHMYIMYNIICHNMSWMPVYTYISMCGMSFHRPSRGRELRDVKGSQNWQELRESVRELEAERDRLRSAYGDSERLLVDSHAEVDILRDQLRQLKDAEMCHVDAYYI